jgi:hypothetical protein
MTVYADRGNEFKTQRVLERNHNIDFDSYSGENNSVWTRFWCKIQIMARLLHIALCGGEPISSQIL